MNKQKITFELDKKLDNATVDEIFYLLKDFGAKNIELDWDELGDIDGIN
jgi:biopolymer transport protein ExbD